MQGKQVTARRRRQLSATLRRIKNRLWDIAHELEGTDEGEAVKDAALHVDEAWGIVDPKRG